MLNKQMIDKLLAMPDDKLLAMLRLVTASSGVNLPQTIDETAVQKIRAILSQVSDDDLTRLTTLLGTLGGRNG